MKEENAKHEFIINLVNHVTKNLKDKNKKRHVCNALEEVLQVSDAAWDWEKV